MNISKNLDPFWAIADQGFNSLVNLFVGFTLARLLGKEQFGVYVLFFSIWLFFYLLQQGGLSQGLIVFFNKGRNFTDTYLLLQMIYISLTVAVVVLIFTFSKSMSSYDSVLIVSFVTYSICQLFREFVRTYNIAKMKFRNSFFLSFSYFLFSALFLSVFFYIDEPIMLVYWFFYSAFISLLIVIFDFYYNSNRYYGKLIANRRNLVAAKKIWKFVKWNILSNACFWGSSNIYKYVTAYFLGLEVLAGVGACQYVMYLSNPIMNGLQNYSISFLSRDGVPENRFVGFLFMIGTAFVISIPMIIAPGLILRVAFGEAYVVYEAILISFGINLIFTTFARIFNIKLIVLKMSRIVFFLNVLTLSVSLPLLYLFVRNYHSLGISAYLILSSVVFFVFSVFAWNTYKNRAMPSYS